MSLPIKLQISQMIYDAEVERDQFAKVLASFPDCELSDNHAFLMAISDHARLVGRVSALYEVLGVY